MHLVLEWWKAFGSVDPQRLCHAPLVHLLFRKNSAMSLVQSVYKDKQFTVRDSGHVSRTHRQHFGISLGCPSSLFSFSILMTVLSFDASAQLHLRLPRSSSDIAREREKQVRQRPWVMVRVKMNDPHRTSWNTRHIQTSKYTTGWLSGCNIWQITIMCDAYVCTTTCIQRMNLIFHMPQPGCTQRGRIECCV